MIMLLNRHATGATTSPYTSLFDTASASEAVDFIHNYFDKQAPSGRRKHFPALFSVYLPGLDHDAHMNGMGSYMSYFQDTVDVKVKEIVQALKDNDEFENKIFIIVSDHGETQMPVDLRYERSQPVLDAAGNVQIDMLSGQPVMQTDYPLVDMSCELNLDMNDKDVRASELKNNSLHIWELGNILKKLNKLYTDIYPGTDIQQKLGFNILAPKEIADLFSNTTYGGKGTLEEASVIAALNGPMAHVYVRDRTTADWKTHGRIVEDIGYLAEVLRLLLSKDKTPSNLMDVFPENIIETVLFDTIGLRQEMTNSIDAILVRKSVVAGENYCVFKGIKQDKSDIICEPLAGSFASAAYIKVVDRINNMESLNRSGDIVLLMKDSTSGNEVDRYSTGYSCKSWHGSLNPGDSYVPFIVTYPGGNRFEIEPRVNATSGCNTTQGCEGNWKVTDLTKKIIKGQY